MSNSDAPAGRNLPDAMGLVDSTLTILLLYSTLIVIYRLVLHPLRSFPGPRIAAVTDYYQAYFDVVKGGQLLKHLRKLHEEYGPVVRIGPNTVCTLLHFVWITPQIPPLQLHFSSGRAYHDIYTYGQTFTKYKPFYNTFGQPDSSLSFIDPQKARSRRALLNPLFSRRAILKLQNVVQERVDKLVQRLSAWPQNEPVNLAFAFKCTSLDIISEYCFANCFKALDTPDFHHPQICAIQDLLPNLWKQKHLPILVTIIDMMPEWLVLWINPGVKPLLDSKHGLGMQVEMILDGPEALKSVDHETIYHHMLDNRPGNARPTRKSLVDEALTLIGGGSDTVGVISTVGTFYALRNPAIAQKLKDELRNVWPDPESSVSLGVLEKLPYLTAFVKESLRLGHGIVSPLPRVIGSSNAVIDGWQVPAGTVVEMSSVLLHENPDVFKNPLEFSPERWLQGNTRDLEFNLVPFSKGPRICLAWCELYLIFANVFRKLDMKIFETTLEDMRNYKEYLLPHWEETLNVVVSSAKE
ncbi:benzoate 4-monooxygenase cytochrome p450 [Moniliophthora roreri]|nr:benzoate 4-monooxygenase cytochrome p450 [Moniliophthora roreri]